MRCHVALLCMRVHRQFKPEFNLVSVNSYAIKKKRDLKRNLNEALTRAAGTQSLNNLDGHECNIIVVQVESELWLIVAYHMNIGKGEFYLQYSPK